MCDHRDGHIDWAMDRREKERRDKLTPEQRKAEEDKRFEENMKHHPKWS